jgi:hypothetical protein
MSKGNLVKITVYLPIELKEYLLKRNISISSWCREAITKKRAKFLRQVEKYNTEPEYHERRLVIKDRCRNKARIEGRKVN